MAARGTSGQWCWASAETGSEEEPGTIILFLSAVRGGSARSLLRERYSLAPKEQWLPLSGESAPVPRGSRWVLLGMAAATLPRNCSRRVAEERMFAFSMQMSGSCRSLRAVCPFLLCSLPQALCTFTIVSFRPGLPAPHPLHVKPFLLCHHISNMSLSLLFFYIVKRLRSQVPETQWEASWLCCCSLLALCPFPSPQAPIVPSGFCSLAETFII